MTSTWLTRTTSERFHAFISGEPQGDDCWVWSGKLATTGYGRFWDGTRNTYAHRHSYEQYVGPIPDGLVIDHLCRNRACCNPAHLEAVTHAENCRRGARGRLITHCKDGHPLSGDNVVMVNGRRRCLTCKRAQQRQRYAERRASQPRRPNTGRPLLREADIPVIRAMYAAGATQKQIAQQFDVVVSTIGMVVRGETWSHV